MTYLIDNLHGGMNLRDDDAAVEKGETRETVGCDFGKLGQVSPMRGGLVAWSLPATIVDAHISYIGSSQYLFVTDANGLSAYGPGVFSINGVTPPIAQVIDAAFTGYFKVLSISGNYFVFSNGSLMKKWKPGWSKTYAWGLNTPPTPTTLPPAA